MNATIEVEPLTPVIGAIVHGVDLAEPLEDETFAAIHRAFLEHQVIFFRNQTLTIEQQKSFGRRFGELAVHPAAPKAIPEHPEVFVVHADENSKLVAGNGWHSDVSCDVRPPLGSILYVTEVPPDGGGDTLFSSMYAAYDALSNRMKQMIDGLRAVHGSEHAYRGRYGKGEQLRDQEYPSAEHPVVRTHPETGKKALYVNMGFTTDLVDLPYWETKALLAFLFEHVQTPEFQCRFRWTPGSVAFWDNRCVQHRSIWDYYPSRRHGFRVAIEGDPPF